MMKPHKKTIYLANAYGFSAQQRELLLPAIVSKLEGMGLQVVEPFETNKQHIDDKGNMDGWEVGKTDARNVRECDALFAVVNGEPPDGGVMVEIGMAAALEKPIFLFRDDFRICSDMMEYPINLMAFTSYTRSRHEWKAYYYTSIAELHTRKKALYEFAGIHARLHAVPSGGEE